MTSCVRQVLSYPPITIVNLISMQGEQQPESMEIAYKDDRAWHNLKENRSGVREDYENSRSDAGSFPTLQSRTKADRDASFTSVSELAVLDCTVICTRSDAF